MSGRLTIFHRRSKHTFIAAYSKLFIENLLFRYLEPEGSGVYE